MPDVEHSTVIERQQVFGYTFEQLRILLAPMATSGVEALGAMGNDTPAAVLSDHSQLLYNYFKQLFAQVTNPPIDAIREELITATEVMLGTELNLLETKPENCRQLKLSHPILTNRELTKIRHVEESSAQGFRARTLSILFDIRGGEAALEQALEDLFQAATKAIGRRHQHPHSFRPGRWSRGCADTGVVGDLWAASLFDPQRDTHAGCVGCRIR